MAKTSTIALKWVLPLVLSMLPLGVSEAQSVSLNIAPSSESFATNVVGIIALTSVLAIAPGILMVGTSFTRLVIVLSMLRTALGLQQTPPNSVIVGLALFLTGTIMAPAFESAYQNAIQPMMNGSITEEQALDRAVKPFRSFMEANTRDKDIALFMELSNRKTPAKSSGDKSGFAETPQPPGDQPETAGAVSTASVSTAPASTAPVSTAARTALPLPVLCSAFLTSELSKAFQIGFLLFLPFLVIDMAVSAILMGMGMMMLPPVVVSLPFKLIFFVLVDGWELVAGSLVRSFSQ
jgi:flagellar biosynthetic protein FliP